MSRSTLTTIKTIARPALCAAVLLVASPRALAQVAGELPRSTVEAISISGSQRAQIEQFIGAWSDRAKSENPQDVKRALEALTDALHGRGVSVAFRQAYAQAITPLMNELSAADSVAAQLSALRIAADLATPNSATRIKTALTSDDKGVQLFAVSRVGQIFATTRKHGPAMTGADAVGLIDGLKTLGAGPDADPELIRACVRALSEGAALSSKDMGDTRSKAIIAMADIVGARLQGLGNSDDPAYAQSLALDAASAATQAISDISSDTTPEAARAAVGLGGDIISVALRRVLGQTIEPTSKRDLTVRSVQAGETLLYFARRKAAELGGQPNSSIITTGYADQLAQGNDRGFRNDASVLLGPGSEIVRRFNFNDTRFVR